MGRVSQSLSRSLKWRNFRITLRYRLLSLCWHLSQWCKSKRKLLSLQPKSRRRHQTIIAITVFITIQCWEREKEASFLAHTNALMKQKIWLIILNLDPRMLIFLIFCVTKWIVHKALPLLTETQSLSQGKSIWATMSCELNQQSSPQSLMVPWSGDIPTEVLQTWICGRHFLKHERNKPVTSRRTINNIHYRFWKTCIWRCNGLKAS